VLQHQLLVTSNTCAHFAYNWLRHHWLDGWIWLSWCKFWYELRHLWCSLTICWYVTLLSWCYYYL